MKRIVAFLFAIAISTIARADGQSGYVHKCKICHGEDGSGTKAAPASIKGMSSEANYKAIVDGKGKMKPVKVDNAKEIADYAATLK